MNDSLQPNRRSFLKAAALGLIANELAYTDKPNEDASVQKGQICSLGVRRQIKAGVLNIGYYETGQANGKVVLLLHGFPYSVDSYAAVAPLLAARGCRVIIPYLRGHGTTNFLQSTTARSGQQSAIGMDVICLMNALNIERALLAGYDWGGRAACVVAALWPERCTALLSVNGYLIQDIARAKQPLHPSVESGLWYQYYFQTERGRAGLIANRHEIARTIWRHNSPTWHFDEATLKRHTSAFDNPDYVDVVIHSYRHRLGLAEGYAPYAELEGRLAGLPKIPVPTITLDGKADGVVPANDGSSAAAKFSGWRSHRVIEHAGHNLPEESPLVFAAAVWELLSGEY